MSFALLGGTIAWEEFVEPQLDGITPLNFRGAFVNAAQAPIVVYPIAVVAVVTVGSMPLTVIRTGCRVDVMVLVWLLM